MKNTAYFFITIIAIVIILIYGQNLLIPFILALLLWFLIRKIRHVIDRLEFIREKVPSWIKNLLVSGIIIVLMSLISKVILNNINQIAQNYPSYEKNVESIILQLNEELNMNLIEYLKTNATEFDFGQVLKEIFNSLSDLLGNALLIVIYALFIFLEEANFDNKLQKALGSKEKYTDVTSILKQIEQSISNYIGMKSLVSLFTGIASYIALASIGIDSPMFWSFLIFILNFIPAVGSMIATLFPAIFCLLQFGAFKESLIVLGVVGAIQLLVGNLIEPKLMGKTLNISPLVAIFALSFWGVLWGVTGMLISVPVTVIIVIICSHFEKTRSIAIMLSDKVKN
ncbi:MAG: AI-2E family transporter [Flavobacteriales bacterium]|nr:AI-2E family transporter [Flavobacteriales bacterium]